MSWTYSGDPSKTAKDAVRFIIGDTNMNDQLLLDAEIAYFLNQYNQAPLNAAIRCCETIITKFGRLADEAVGQVRISYSQKAKNYRDIVKDLRQRLSIEDMTPFAGGISRSQKEIVRANADRVKPDFSKHEMENKNITPRTTSEGGPFDVTNEGDD